MFLEGRTGKSIFVEVSTTGLHRRRRYNQEEQYRYGLQYRCASWRGGFNGLGNCNEIDDTASRDNVTSSRVCPVTRSRKQWTYVYSRPEFRSCNLPIKYSTIGSSVSKIPDLKYVSFPKCNNTLKKCQFTHLRTI